MDYHKSIISTKTKKKLGPTVAVEVQKLIVAYKLLNHKRLVKACLTSESETFSATVIKES